MKINLRNILIAAVVLVALSGQADNMLFNSSFELGDKGYTLVRRTEYRPGEKIDHASPGAFVAAERAFHGEHSIRMCIAPADEISLSSHEFELKAGKKYCLSFYARTSGPQVNVNVTMLSLLGGWRSVNWMSFTINEEWKRYETSFTVEKEFKHEYEKHYFLYLKVPFGQGDRAGLWIDAIQLEEGMLTPYSPARNIECAIYTQSLLKDEAQLKGSIKVISYDKPVSDLPLSLALTDDFFKKTLDKKELKMNLTSGKTAVADFSFATKRLGELKITPSSSVAFSEQSSARSVWIQSPQKMYGPGFQTGILAGCMELISVNRDQRTDMPYPLIWSDAYGPPGEFGRLVRMTGATFAHSFGNAAPFFVPFFEPEHGKYQWALADLFMQSVEDNRLAAVAALPSQWFLRVEKGTIKTPEWLRRLDRAGKPDGSDLGGWAPTSIIPPAEILKEQCAAIAGRYGNKIVAYEPFSEANGYIRANYAAEYIKAVHDGVKKTCPSAEVIGVIGTEDAGSNAREFFAACLEAGQSKNCDAYQFHPYAASMDDSPVSAMALIRKLKEICRESNAEKPLWNTEVYYLLPSRQEHYSLESTFTADALARRLLIDMGEGVAKSSPLLLSHLFHSPERPNQSWPHNEKTPSARFAVFSAAARFTTGAKPLKTLELSGKRLCYIFQNNDQIYNAIWAISGKGDMRLTLPPGIRTSVYDLFGNRLQDGEKSIQLAIDRRPLYIQWHGATAAVVSEILQHARYMPESALVITHPKLTFDTDGRLCAGIIIRNETGDTVSGSVRVNSESLFDHGSTVSYGEINAFAEKLVLVPLRIKGDAPEHIPVKVIVSLRDRLLHYDHIMKNVKTIKLKNADSSKIFSPAVVNGANPADFSSSFSLSRKGNELQVRINIVDDKPGAPKSNNKPWEGDCAEIYLDLKPFEGDLAYMGKHTIQTYQLIIPLHTPGNVQAVRIADGKPLDLLPLKTTAEVRRFNGTCEAVVSIRLESVLGDISGKTIAFTMAFSDNDEGIYKYHAAWTGTENYRDRSGYALLYFDK